MKIYEITFSPTGGTEKAAHLLMEEAPEKIERINLLKYNNEYSEYVFEEDDICLAAVPSYGGRVPELAVQRLLQMKGNGARCILTVVYGNRAYEDTLLELKETMKTAGFRPIAAVTAVAEHSIMHRFAAGRPDAEDEKELKGFSREIWKKLQSGEEIREVDVPGSKEYKEYHVTPMKQTVGEECSGCGLCAEKCPAAAISKENPKQTDKEKCISCMRCISVCPKRARTVDEADLTLLVQKLEKVCTERKKNEMFIG